MNPYIFRKYDIRGVVEKDFSNEVVKNIGKAYGTLVKRKGAKKISISGDIRKTTPHLKEIFTEGVLSTGVDVVDIGILPTPANYYSMYKMDIDGAVQVTGSHNPPDMNGFKMAYKKLSVYGEDIQKLHRLIEEEDFEEGDGELNVEEILSDYNKEIVSGIQLEKDVKVAMDCGNGAACLSAPEALEEIGCDVTKFYCTVDGNFPNHHPDPTVQENIEDLIREVKKGDYDFGVAFDGDADRIGVIDDSGQAIWADYIMILFLDEVIEQGEKVIFDVKCSQALEDMIIEKGGEPLMWKTGHSLIKEKMREEGVKFAGEMSGHICFADDYYGYDDAIYAALRFAQMVSRQSEKLSTIIEKLPNYYSTPEMRLDCPDDKTKFEIAEKSAKYFKENYDCIDVDGVRIKFGDGWGLVRASNTQPVIVTRFEAKTEARLAEIKNLVLSKLEDFGEIEIP
ncbi:MAG: phosphomannomutase/phosphoglucomutase [Candidatus Marinimicrobia bacterium]|nr:phosphomannomutase/phosphoglucomutase [Candidatus Neomarinimicrobiota bacterium]